MTKGEKLVLVIPAQIHSTVDEWWFPEDVAALLNLCDLSIYGTGGYKDKMTQPTNRNCFCDVWKRETLTGDGDERVGRVLDSKWVETQQEAIDFVVNWVRAGMPDGFGEATGKKI